jgi:catechol 2,3-dioxygenase-like lactoylglutathione lyase family enzyme
MEEAVVEAQIADLVGGFESGRITRRELVSRLSLMMAAVAAAPPAASQSSASPFTATGFNHISFVVSDYARTRDFYAGLFGLKVTNDDPKAKQCQLHLADGSFILPRNAARPNVTTPVVNHFALGIADWDKARIEAELKRRGLRYGQDLNIPRDSVHLRDPNGYDLQLVNDKVKG